VCVPPEYKYSHRALYHFV